MKKTILSLAAGLIATLSFAQTQKGYWMPGISFGGTSFNSSNSKSTSSNSATEYSSKGNSFGLSVSPSAMYFICDNLAVGGNFGVSFSTSKNSSSNNSTTNVSNNKYNGTSFSFGPQIRGYFGEPGSKGQPWVEAIAGISTSPYKSENTNTEIPNRNVSDSKSNGWNAGANFGYSHFFNSHIALKYFIGYRHSHNSSNTDYKPDPGSAYSYKAVNNSDNINFGIGLQIHIPSASVKK